MKLLPGSVLSRGLLDEDGQLLVEVETYAGEEARVAADRNSSQQVHAARTGGPGRFRSRSR